MTDTDTDTDHVLAAAAALVAAFGRHDPARYCASFSPEATFVFYTVPTPLRSRAAYEELWRSWEREDGFEVLSCSSSDQHVQVIGEVAVFTHAVHTQARLAGMVQQLEERETIVFRRDGRGGWIAVHEHLSSARPVA